MLFLGTSHHIPSPNFLLFVGGDGVLGLHFRELLSSWVSLMYTGCMHVVKLLFVFPLLICLLLRGSLSQETRRVEGKLFFLPYGT